MCERLGMGGGGRGVLMRKQGEFLPTELTELLDQLFQHY